jgi:hypothetical protein
MKNIDPNLRFKGIRYKGIWQQLYTFILYTPISLLYDLIYHFVPYA